MQAFPEFAFAGVAKRLLCVSGHACTACHMRSRRTCVLWGCIEVKYTFAVFYEWLADIQARTCTTLALCATWKFQQLRA